MHQVKKCRVTAEEEMLMEYIKTEDRYEGSDAVERDIIKMTKLCDTILRMNEEEFEKALLKLESSHDPVAEKLRLFLMGERDA